jgi:hypothetical protein
MQFFGISGGFLHRGTIGVPMHHLAVRAANAAGLGAGAQCLLDDGLDGARAAAAFGAAAKATVDLLGIAGKVFRCLHGTTDIVVAEDVTGTDNHKSGRPMCDTEPFDIEEGGRMQKEKRCFEVIPKLCWGQLGMNLNISSCGKSKAGRFRKNEAKPQSLPSPPSTVV